MKHIQLLTCILFVCFYTSSFAQSISGNAFSELGSKKLGYANVNIYKGDKLVANVLTDEKGDFNVRLDTGYYKCEIEFAGYKKITKNIHVVSDEKADFALASDTTSKYYKTKIEPSKEGYIKMGYATTKTEDVSGEVAIGGIEIKSSSSRGAPKVIEDAVYMKVEESSPSYEMAAKSIKSKTSKPTTSAWGTIDSSENKYGKLTAGEINDFCKWSLWNDVSQAELKNKQKVWNFAPTHRYMVQVTSKNGLPIVGATAELYTKNTILFRAITDNTGKAELWENLSYDSVYTSKNPSIRITYNDSIKEIKNATIISQGVNAITFNTDCNKSDIVEIALIVDATGSMGDELEYLKSDLNRVIFKSKEISTTLQLHFANIFYRDHGDTYVTDIQDFTSVLSESIAYTNMHSAGGGGDGPEAVEIALDSAINKLSWSDDSRTKILFLVLDAPPHNTVAIQNKMRELAVMAAAKGIRIVPIAGSGIEKDTEYLMRCLALATNGTYTFLTDHSGIGGSHLKPTTDSYTVEILNDLLVRVIKSYTYMPECNKEIKNMEIALPTDKVTVNVEDTITDAEGDAENIDVEFEWKYYPNPTSGIITIEANKDITELYISDLSGKAIMKVSDIKASTPTIVDLSMFPAGIYLIRYPIGKQWISGKIILKR